jgi:hypothetical protein
LLFNVSLGKCFWRPQITRGKMGWRFGSSSRVPVLQARSPEFKIPVTPKEKRKKVSTVFISIFRDEFCLFLV